MTDIPNIPARHQDLIQGWKTDMEIRQHPFDTVRTYLSALRGWLAHLDVTPPQDAGKNELKSYAAHLQGLQRKPSTFQSHFAAISSLFDYMIEEGIMEVNPVPAFQRRYMRLVGRQVKKGSTEARRQLISVQAASSFLAGIGDIRDRCINATLAKTGLRREELSAIDLPDINWANQSIYVKDTFHKRTNNVVYFDDELNRLLKRWLRVREGRGGEPEEGALFIGPNGERLGAKSGIYNAVRSHAEAAGLHKPGGKVHETFTPHNWRHWFTTHLRRAGMPEYMIAELRGDSEARTMDIYTHIDHEELRRVYLARIPQLGL